MVDLHMHTTHSDGEFSPIKVLKKCEDVGLEIISITDHDGYKAYYDLDKLNIKNYFSGRIIKGVELTTIYKGRIIEILAYDIDVNILQNWFSIIYTDERKKERISYCRDRVIENLAKLGIVIDKNNLATDISYDAVIYNGVIKQDNKDILGDELLMNIKNFYRLGTGTNNNLCLEKEKISWLD